MIIQELLDKKDFKNIPIIKQDAKWRITHFKSEDREYEAKYDKEGRLVYTKENGNTKRFKYALNWEVSYIYDNWYEEWRKYDKAKRIVKIYDNVWVTTKKAYHRNTKRITYTFEQWPDWHVFETWKDYDSKGNMILNKSSDGSREKWEFAKTGKLKWETIYYECSDWSLYRKEYDKESRTITISDENWVKEKHKFDRRGKKIMSVVWDYTEIYEWEKCLEIKDWLYILNWVKLDDWNTGKWAKND